MSDEARAALAQALAESERRRADLEELLERERAAGRQAVADAEANGAVLTVLARELRGPMNAALGWTRFLRTELLSREGRDHALSLVERDVGGAVNLVDDFLDVVGLATHRTRVRTRVQIADLLGAVVASTTGAAVERHLIVDLQLPDATLGLDADVLRLERLVERLLQTAIHLTVQRTKLSLHATRIDAAVRIEALFTPVPEIPSALPRSWDDVAPAALTPSTTAVNLFLLEKLAEAQRGTIVLASDGERSVLRLELAQDPQPTAEEAFGIERCHGAS